ncbi:MFS transporter [Verrucomicrobiota bacterium]
MTRFLIYLFPAMMDMVIGSILFVCTVRMAESGASAMAVTAVMAVSSLLYMVSAQVVGRLVTDRNAAWILIGASLSMMLLAAAFVLIPGLLIMYLLVAVQAVSTGFFFTPFQVFMKAVEQGRTHGIVRPTAFYTFSWSAGMACGPFAAGYLWVMAGWQWCHAVNAGLALATALGIYCLKHHAHERPAPEVSADKEGKDIASPYAGMPDLVWLSWTAGGVGCVTWFLLRSLFPATGVALNISKPGQGTVLALVLGMQAITGLSLFRSRTWMYRAAPVAAFSVFGIAALILFGCVQSTAGFYGAAICFGVYSGSFFFYFVFHALSHPRRSARYVAINETIVGLAGILGPFVGGFLADRFSFSVSYFVAAGMIVCATVLQVTVHGRQRHLIPGIRLLRQQGDSQATPAASPRRAP